MIGPEDERVRRETGPGFDEAVTFAWGDAGPALFGTARIGLAPGEPARGTGLGLLFQAGQAVVSLTEQAEVESPEWRSLAVGRLSTATLAPLERWRVELDAPEGGFELEFSALTEPAELEEGSAAARAAGLRGYEQLCAVRGAVRTGASRVDVDCLGQRGRQWGTPDWDGLALTRTVSAWLEPELAVGLTAVRPAWAEEHEDDALTAWLVQRAGEEGAKPEPVAEPRLSTVYDSEGRQRRAGLELWIGAEDDFPRRAAGEALCGASLELGPLRFDAAFFRWRMEGRTGVGRYDVLRRA